MDVYLYNGEISRSNDLKFIELVSDTQESNQCLVILVTPGGDPDAAYKMARYLQRRYDSYKVLISGYCKSAGTLFAIGANELIFTPYGELGPLDVQMARTDHLTGLESGLNISEAFSTLENRARETYQNVTFDIISSSGGVVSFPTASHAATEIVTALYGPIFSRIDPEEVGSRSRAMRIGEDYGKRLNSKWNNLKPGALAKLSQTYSSHGFVIDSEEAEALFSRVRMANDEELGLVLELGLLARHPQRSLTLQKVRDIGATNLESDNDHEETADDEEATERPDADGENPPAAVGTESAATGDEDSDAAATG
ncbi:hypothetical protein JJB09_24650 [Rhizobium sp. KVB221]|uniref:SppA protein n=1 Tax=Rhizobium setariae TaxID=2801340 RepID=A0A936YWY3_9HYPH|nr:hypothetical protein [Rhizobium setariae]MBL0375210.1 hypothetical protein [Rhizobium setariae]